MARYKVRMRVHPLAEVTVTPGANATKIQRTKPRSLHVSSQQNKQRAIELFERFTNSDIPGVLGLMTEDATWLIPGKPELSPSAGLYDKRKIGKLFNIMLGRLKSGLKMKVRGAIAEGDQVAIEVESEGD